MLVFLQLSWRDRINVAIQMIVANVMIYSCVAALVRLLG